MIVPVELKVQLQVADKWVVFIKRDSDAIRSGTKWIDENGNEYIVDSFTLICYVTPKIRKESRLLMTTGLPDLATHKKRKEYSTRMMIGKKF